MDPAAEYRQRWQLRTQSAATAAVLERRIGAAKLAVFFGLLALAWLAWITHLLSSWWLLPVLGGLIALFVWHDRALARRERARNAVQFYEHGLARLEDRWSGLGADGARFRDPAHAYADDLDLFGPGSLFQLLCAARTAAGEERLAAWLKAPAAPAEARGRQARVSELRDQLDRRERVAALGGELEARLDPAVLRTWSQIPGRVNVAAWVAAAGLVVVTVASLVWALAAWNWGPFFALVLVQLGVVNTRRARIRTAIGNFGANSLGLNTLAAVLGETGRPEGTAALRQLARLADWAEVSDTLMGHLLDTTVLYSLQLGFLAAVWRQHHGAAVAGWLNAVAEFEALLSLAGYAYEHPADPFPEWSESSAASFAADDLGHPLLPQATCVRNSIHLGPELRLAIISGSNMSGKSTLLRTLGINAVLAQMGAPVRARRLQLSPLAIGTRLRTADSLQMGRSGFYAEILRLRQVFELTQAGLPVLYLFDELLEGTNSHDRVIGAKGLLQALLVRPALGAVTTHDLALTALAAELGPEVANFHLEDQIEGNDVRFDHCLRVGVVTKSNALALMRLVGLEV